MFSLWAALIAYAVFFAPGKSGEEDDIMKHLLTGSFEQADPLVVMVFSFLGIFPMIFALLILPNDTRKLPAWPFVLGSFALGAFSLLPYFFLRKERKHIERKFSEKTKRLRDSKLVILILAVLTAGLYLFGIFMGSIERYSEAFQSSQLVSVMTADLFVLTWLSWYVLKHEYKMGTRAFYSFIPVLGPLCLLLLKEKK
ncbi:hypothetical protein ACTSEZ_06705 [Metabacillus sp. JX24]|uniref:DUF2834 domain-containing protein n=1 Tax=Metabacillus indicus TaxID=246786 RepID=A0A084H111_METID|nr:hypothetical protein [Metabacillus indicus]KEZ53273.1 hypothetical protein GS18_0206620 [Metabacillus indicus]